MKHDSFNQEEYQALCDYCGELEIEFLSTPFDYASADYLDGMMKRYKISSSDITNLPLYGISPARGSQFSFP